MQNPAHDAMVERSGWFDDSQESRVFLPRRSSSERLATLLKLQEFPTGWVRAPLHEFFELQRRQLEVPRLPDPALKNRSHTKRSLCSANHWLPNWRAIGNKSEWLTDSVDKESNR